MHKKLLNKILPIALSVAMTVQMTPESVLAAEMDASIAQSDTGAQPAEANSEEVTELSAEETKKQIKFDVDSHSWFDETSVGVLTNVENASIDGNKDITATVSATGSAITFKPSFDEGYEVGKVTVDYADSASSSAITWVADGNGSDLTKDNDGTFKLLPDAFNQLATAASEANAVVTVKIESKAKQTGAITADTGEEAELTVKHNGNELSNDTADVTSDYEFSISGPNAEYGYTVTAVAGEAVDLTVKAGTNGNYVIPSSELIDKCVDKTITIKVEKNNGRTISFDIEDGCSVEITEGDFKGHNVTNGTKIKDSKKNVQFKVNVADKNYEPVVKYITEETQSKTYVLTPSEDKKYEITSTGGAISESGKVSVTRKRIQKNLTINLGGSNRIKGIIPIREDGTGDTAVTTGSVSIDQNKDYRFKLSLANNIKTPKVSIKAFDENKSTVCKPDNKGIYTVSINKDSTLIFDFSKEMKIYRQAGITVKNSGTELGNNLSIDDINTPTILTVTLADTVAKGTIPLLNGEKGTKVNGSNRSYSFTVDPSADELRFTLAEDDVKETYTVTDSVSNATIAYKNLCVKNGKVEVGNDIVFTVKPKSGYEVDHVKYSIATTANDTTTKTVALKNGVYTIPADEITGNVTISPSVVAIGKESNTVTFNVENGLKVIIGNDTITSSGTKSVKVGESLTFKVEGDENNKLAFVGVTEDEESAISGSGSSYTIVPTHAMTLHVKKVVTKNAAVSQETARGTYATSNAATVQYKTSADAEYAAWPSTQLKVGKTVYFKISGLAANHKIEKVTFGSNSDRTKNAVLTVNENGEGSFVVPSKGGTLCVFTTLDESSSAVNKLSWTISGGKATVHVGDKEFKDAYLTTDSTHSVVIKPDAGYEITGITDADNEEVASTDSNGDKTVTINYGDKKNASLKIAVDYVKNTSRKKFTFQNPDSSIFDVSVKPESADKEKDGSYKLRTGVKTLDFTITTKNGRVPQVMFGDDAYEATVSGNTYTYSIPASLVTDDSTIVISDNTQSTTLRFIKEHIKSFEVKVNGNVVNPTGTDFYRGIEPGDKVTVKVKAQDNFVISDITQKLAGQSSKTSVNQNEYTFTYTASKDPMTVLVETTGLTSVSISNTGTPNFGEDGIHKLNTQKTYTAKLMTGEEQLDIADAKFVESGISTNVTCTSNLAIFTIDAKDSGKTLTLNLYDKKATDADAKVIGTAKISVASILKSVTFSKGSEVVVAPGSETVYEVILPEKADLTDKQMIWKCDNSSFAVVASRNRNGDQITHLTVTAPTEDAKVANIKIYLGTETADNLLGQMKVTTDAGSITNASVVPTQIAATDTELYIGIEGPKELPELASGKYFYEVTYTPDEAVTTLVTGPKYIPYKEGGITRERVKVDNAVPGKGEPHSYTVSVRLVQSSAANETAVSSTNIVAASKASAEVKMSTRKAYYEDNLKCKVVTKKVFTGQVVNEAIIPVYSANAAVLELEAEDVTPNKSDGEKVTAVSDNGAIKITVPRTASLGIHKIKVSTIPAEGMQPVSTTVEIKVVRGIVDISLEGPSEVYKPAGKKAVVQLKTKLNYGLEKYKPNAPKVTYEVDAINGNAKGTYEFSKYASLVSVSKDGKVTIAKQAGKEIQSITVKASAADYTGDSTLSSARNDSYSIAVKSTKAEIGNIVIVDKDGKVLVSGNKATVAADQLDGAYIKVLKADTKTKDIYAAGDYDSVAVDYNSNYKDKGIKIADYDGKITVTSMKPDMKVNFTVVSEDGTKTTKKLTNIRVTYAEASDLGLKLESSDTNRSLDNRITNKQDGKLLNAVSYNANGARKFDITLVDKNIKQLTSKFYGYSVKLEGATAIEKDASGHPTKIVVNGKKATITLKNLTNGAKTVYTLTNNAIATKKAPAITVDKLVAGTGNPDVDRTVTVKAKTNAKYAFVKIDPVAFGEYNPNGNNDKYVAYQYFMLAMIGGSAYQNGKVVELDKGAFKLEFRPTDIKVGNYKLQVTYGNELRDDGTLIADYKTANAIVKAVAPVKAEAKVNKKYKMSLADATSVQLTFTKKTKTVSKVVFKELLNANVEGNPNAFNKLFTVDEDGILSINRTADFQKLIDEGNNTHGYVTYEVTGTDGITTKQSQLVEITFVESAGVYKTSEINVSKGITTTTTKILFNGKPIKLTDVEIESKNGISAVLDTDKTTIKLSDIPEKKGAYKVKLTFGPENTLVPGTKITINALVKVTDGKNIGKLVFKNSDTNIDLSGITTTTRAADQKAGYYVPTESKGKTGYYVTKVPYEMKTVVDLTKLTVASSNPAVVVENDADNSLLIVKIYRSDVTGAKYADTNVTIGFEDASMKKEKVALSIKLPKAVSSFADIVSKGNAALETLQLKATGNSATINQIIDAFEEATGLNATRLVSSGNGNDVLATFTSDESEMDVTLKATETFIAPTPQHDGAAFVTAIYTNKAEATDSKNRTVEKEVKAIITYGTASDRDFDHYYYTNKEHNGNGKANVVTNDTNPSDIVADLTTYLQLTGGKRLFVTSVIKKPATDVKEGWISISAKVVDRNGDVDMITESPIDVEIEQLKSSEDVKNHVTGNEFKSNAEASYIKATEDAVKAFVKEQVAKAATNKDEYLNTDIEYTYVPQTVTEKDSAGKDVKVKKDIVIDTTGAQATAKFELAITNKKSAFDKDQVTKTGSVIINVVKEQDEVAVVNSLVRDVADIVSGDGSITIDTKKPVELNTQEAFDQAVNIAIANANPKSDVTITKQIVSVVPAQYAGKYISSSERLDSTKAKGKVKICLKVTKGNTSTYVYTNGNSVVTDSSEPTVGENILTENGGFQTIDNLVSDIQIAIENKASKYNRTTTGGAVLADIDRILTDVTKNSSKLSASVTRKSFTEDADITFVAPTANSTGILKANIVVREYDHNEVIATKLCPISITLSKDVAANTPSSKAKDIEIELNKLYQNDQITNADKTDEFEKAYRAKVLVAANAAINSSDLIKADDITSYIFTESIIGHPGNLTVTVTVGGQVATLKVPVKAINAPKTMDEAVAVLKERIAKVGKLDSIGSDYERKVNLRSIQSNYLGTDYELTQPKWGTEAFKVTKASNATEEGTATVTLILTKDKETRRVPFTFTLAKSGS